MTGSERAKDLISLLSSAKRESQSSAGSSQQSLVPGPNLECNPIQDLENSTTLTLEPESTQVPIPTPTSPIGSTEISGGNANESANESVSANAGANTGTNVDSNASLNAPTSGGGIAQKRNDEDDYGLVTIARNSNILEELMLSVGASSSSTSSSSSSNVSASITTPASSVDISTVEAALFPPADVVSEEKDAKDWLRKDLRACTSSSGSGGWSNFMPMESFDFEDMHNITQLRLDESFLLNNRTLRPIVGKAMNGTGCRIRVDAAQYLSEAIQLMTKNVLDSAMLSHSRRNNQFGVRAYYNIQSLLSLKDGPVPPESRVNIGMIWGPDSRSKMLEQADYSDTKVTNILQELEEALLPCMKEFDNKFYSSLSSLSRSPSSSPSSLKRRKKKASDGTSAEIDRETVLEQAIEPWWIRDAEMISNGSYSHLQVIMAHIKLSIAKRSGLGPFDARNKSSNLEKNGPINGVDSENNGSSDRSASENATTNLKRKQAASIEASGGQWYRQPCPIESETERLLQIRDIAVVLSSLPASTNAATYNEGLESIVTKLGVGMVE